MLCRHDAADPSEPTPGSPITPADSSHLLSLTTRLRMFTFCVLAGSTGVYCLYTAAVWVISHVVAPVLLTLAASVAWSLGLVHSPSVQAVTIATMAAVVLLNKRQVCALSSQTSIECGSTVLLPCHACNSGKLYEQQSLSQCACLCLVIVGGCCEWQCVLMASPICGQVPLLSKHH